VTSDPPDDQAEVPAPDTTEEVGDPTVGDAVDPPDDTAPANSDEPQAAVTPETESTPVESTDADDPDAPEGSDTAEPVRDSIFDRKAELVGVDAVGAGNTSGSNGEHDSSNEEGGGTVFGCNLPLGNSNVVGSEYALLGVGLLGLGLRRPAGGYVVARPRSDCYLGRGRVRLTHL